MYKRPPSFSPPQASGRDPKKAGRCRETTGGAPCAGRGGAAGAEEEGGAGTDAGGGAEAPALPVCRKPKEAHRRLRWSWATAGAAAGGAGGDGGADVDGPVVGSVASAFDGASEFLDPLPPPPERRKPSDPAEVAVVPP
jgi:hypothetical protein